MDAETYRCTPELHGNGMFYFTDCGNVMYYVDNDPMRWHGRSCPKCFMKGKIVTLYIRGSEEAIKLMEEQK